jgi:hypothetical protein
MAQNHISPILDDIRALIISGQNCFGIPVLTADHDVIPISEWLMPFLESIAICTKSRSDQIKLDFLGDGHRSLAGSSSGV